MAQLIVDHATLEEIITKFQDAYPERHELWIKPEKSAGVNLMPFLIRSLNNLHKDLCAQHLHDISGGTHYDGKTCTYCGFGFSGNSDSVGPMSGLREYGVEI